VKILFGALFSIGIVVWLTYSQMHEPPRGLTSLVQQLKKPHFVDRNGVVLNTTYTNRYNVTDLIELSALPKLFIDALLLSEDQNFYEHSGVDWPARFRAVWQNIKAHKQVRGASTITEQVIKIIYPRERTLWAKWLEGFEAYALQQRFSKEEILTFYINQIPYGANRKGVKQAATYYFGRAIETLNEKEMLALVVMIRSPRWYHPFRHPKRTEKKILQLAQRLYEQKKITALQYKSIATTTLYPSTFKQEVNAQHFIAFVNSQLNVAQKRAPIIKTTLDASLQTFVQQTLNTKVTALNHKNVHNGAAIIIDHQSNEVLAWAVAYAGESDKAFNHYDPLLVPRQPGSTLKPFLYALALEKGWEATLLINDAPLSEGVGLGIHSYHNYSNCYYGPITLREALGNSLNIPAIKTVQFVGVVPFLKLLHELGISTLTQHPNYYGDGIALGNAEVTLYELARAYNVLANMGIYTPLQVLQEHQKENQKRVIQERVASLIGNILSDPTAREKEFGRHSILNLPHQTAIKTGTSSDYRDAWTLGYDDRYTIGVWFGNLDYESMKNITGSSGAAHVLKTLFTHLSKNRESRALFLSPELTKKRLCIKKSNTDSQCSMIDEFLLHDTNHSIQPQPPSLKIISPTKNLIFAKDPRIPDAMEYYTFRVTLPKKSRKIEWYLNNTLTATTTNPSLEWAVTRGDYDLHVKVFLEDEERMSERVHFSVK
jgi:penicillin-binding protein 1C